MEEQDYDPFWDIVFIEGCDFHPHFDGYLYNLFTCELPCASAIETEKLFVSYAVEIAQWLINHQRNYGTGDQFQIIIGWPRSVRPTSRQVIKTGGPFKTIEEIAIGDMAVPMRPYWDNNIF